MTQRNYNNVTTVGQLTGSVSSASTSVVVSNFSNYPAVPFTITLDRNTSSEEICLVTAVIGSSLSLTRGFDGSAAQAHAAGATVEHTAVALDFTEANAHVNATANVHGTTGVLVDSASAQTIQGKTFKGNTHVADTTLGDAVVASVPTAAGVRNMFRGVGADGNDKFTVDNLGNVTGAGVSLTSVSNTVATHSTSISTINGSISGKADKTYVDSQDTATLVAAKAYTDAHTSPTYTVPDTGWLSLSSAIQSGYTSVAGVGAKYRVKQGIAYVDVAVQRTGSTTTAGSQDTVIVLPVGARPTTSKWAAGVAGGTAWGEVRIDSNGNVINNGAVNNGGIIVVSFAYPVD